MRLLVTGGAGYLGSVLVKILLERTHSVRVLDNLSYGGDSLLSVWSHPNFEFVLGDIRDTEIVRRSLKGIDAVIHLSAIVGDPACSRQPALARSVNIEASISLLTECKRNNISRFVFASTCSNYGKMKDPMGYVDETSELNPLSLYAETKVTVEKIVLDPSRTNDFCATSLRFATLFGVSPRMRFDLTLNEFTLEMLTKNRLSVYGGQFWRPYVHVEDAARAVAFVLEAPIEQVRVQAFNVGSTDQNYQKLQLVELIRPYAPNAVVEYIKKEEDPRDYRVSFAKVRDVLGFKVTKTVPNGIHEVAKLILNKIIQDADNPKCRN